jgi:polysaccharide export outer membrane protein
MTLKSLAGISMLLGAVCVYGQEPDKALPKELVQYVLDAQRAGQNSPQIQQSATNAGWPLTTVNDALAYVKSMDKEKEKKEAAQPDTVASASGPAAAPATTGAADATPPAGAEKPTADRSATVAPTAAAEKTDAAAGPSPAPKETVKAPAEAAAHTAAPGGTPAVHAANTPEDYQIGAGDILKITVWHEPDASIPSTIVLPTGRISVPLLHEIDVSGLTVPQLEKLLTDRFSTLINSPEVSVTVMGMNSKKIYMTGKVKKEGPLAYVYEMTVMQALTEAGGVTDYAKKKGIYVLRTENGKQFKIDFDYAAVLKGQRLETNIRLIPGDMIVVP